MIKLPIPKAYLLGLFLSLFFAANTRANLIPWRDGLTTFKHEEIKRLYFVKAAAAIEVQKFTLGHYTLELSPQGLKISNQEQRELFSSLTGKAFLVGSHKSPQIKSNRFGAAYLKVKMGKKTCNEQTIHSISFKDQQLTLSGNLYGEKCFIPYSATFSAGERGQLKISIQGKRDHETIWLGIYGSKVEGMPFYGGGEQFTELNLDGNLIPFLTQEQGHGRGRYWTSLPFDLVTGGLSGGDRFSTYIPIPLIFSRSREGSWFSLKARGSHYSIADLREKNAMALWSLTDHLNLEINHAQTPLEMVAKNAQDLGLPHPTPEWFYEGAVLGGFLEGEENVYQLLKLIDQYHIPTKALWIEDWSGIDKTIDGSRRLKWNWEVDRRLYPHWDKMVTDIKARGIRVGGYLNPLARELKEEDLPYHQLHMMNELKAQKL